MQGAAKNTSKNLRSCNACTACCIGLEIESQPGLSTTYDTGIDIAKPAGVPCRFATPSGCANYEHRPLICRRFACDWLIGRAGYDQDASPPNVGIIGVHGNPVVVNL